MTPRERILAALNLKIPDRVPYFESAIEPEIVLGVCGRDDLDEKEISKRFHRDHITWWIFPAPFVQRKEIGGREFFVKGLIKSDKDLKLLKHMQYYVSTPEGTKLIEIPDPNDKKIYTWAAKFVEDKEEFAATAMTCLGIDPTIHSMGWEGFSYMLYDNPKLIERVLSGYVEFNAAVVDNLCKIGFDFIWAGDDIAFDSGPFFSPEVLRELVLPKVKIVTDRITIPWIFHSDGNLMPILDDLLSLGMNAIHPIDPNCMNIEEVKHRYGSRICIVGNINMNNLKTGTPDQVEQEVKEKIEKIAPGGGYIVSSGNSLIGGLRPENVKSMVEAVVKYGKYKRDGNLVYFQK
ncbi:hypothetical protein J7M02_07595 [Candidatus Aerophobetes bacterium]|nr:hypothetical protein [Candidatus Aerophobetes bacterium]